MIDCCFTVLEKYLVCVRPRTCTFTSNVFRKNGKKRERELRRCELSQQLASTLLIIVYWKFVGGHGCLHIIVITTQLTWDHSQLFHIIVVCTSCFNIFYNISNEFHEVLRILEIQSWYKQQIMFVDVGLKNRPSITIYMYVFGKKCRLSLSFAIFFHIPRPTHQGLRSSLTHPSTLLVKRISNSFTFFCCLFVIRYLFWFLLLCSNPICKDIYFKWIAVRATTDKQEQTKTKKARTHDKT